jgi:signal peptidase II
MQQKLSQTGLRWLWITLIILAVDRITKISIQHQFQLYDSIRVTSFFNLTLAYNKGAAFSFLNSAPGWQMWMFGAIATLVSASLVIWMLRLKKTERWVSIALAFIVGGAIGNLWDRICYGHVIDFIQWHIGNFYWPVFNIADSAICVGAVMLVLDAIFRKK